LPTAITNPLATAGTCRVYTILAIAALAAAAFGLGYAIGRVRRAPVDAPAQAELAATPVMTDAPATALFPSTTDAPATDGAVAERARLIRSFEAEAHALRHALVNRDAAIAQLGDFAAERRRLFGEIAQSRAETARYRQLVLDLENNAPPPWFGPGAPDDFKLIVGVGPVLERMLHQLGVTTYRQIARWSERDIDEFDAKLPEFPGRIRRDTWVTQARALHHSKYGETLPPRGR
jgi:predicted flap endonuclease-1-like 5' DNA nuclease